MAAQPPGPDMANPAFGARAPGAAPPPRPQPAPGPPRPFLPGGPVGPPRAPPRPSGPNSFAPQGPPQGPPQSPSPQPRPPGPPYQPAPGPYPPGAAQLPPGAPGPRPPLPRQPGPNPLEKQNSFQQQQRPPAPPLGQVSRQGSLANLGLPPDSPGGQPRRPPMEPDGSNPALAKNRSYSIAGPPGPAPGGMHEEDRRRSVSALGGRPEETIARPGLAFIKEGVQSFDKKESPLNVGLTRLSKEDVTRGSRESIKSDSSDGKGGAGDRPESRLSGSKMTESIMGSLDSDDRKNGSPQLHSPYKKRDDDDDVVLQNNAQKSASPAQNGTPNKSPSPNPQHENGHKAPIDRSPSLSRTDSSPDQKLKTDSPNRPSSVLSSAPRTPEPAGRSPAPEGPRPASTLSNASEKREDTPEPGGRPASRAGAKPTDFGTPIKTSSPDDKKSIVTRKAMSAPRARREGDNDSGVDESTQGNEHVNGSPGSPGKKSPSKIPGLRGEVGRGGAARTPVARSPSKSAVPHTPDSTTSNTSIDKKKVPMNKVQVGAAPSPNIKAVKSKIGSLENATHKPGGGKIRIESRKLDFKAAPKIAAKNDTYVPGGGDKKITQKKLQWTAKSKIGSLENATHKPGGGDKKIETVKLDFKDKAKPKVASTVNITHKPGGGDIKSTNAKDGRNDIENQKLEIKAQSKVGSLDNVKHKPGGGDIKIFDDKDYLKQVSATSDVNTPISEDFSEYISLQDMSRRQSLAPRSMLNGRSSARPQRPRTAREPSASRYRNLSPRKCQTPRIEVGMERPPFRIY